jgi:malate dehydrogenase (oxaloacetate-decarboxylating)
MATTLPITQPDVLNIPRGADLLDTPTLNKGTAFTEEERTEFGLRGLLPPHVETLDEQAVRAYQAFQTKDNDLERHIYLRALVFLTQTSSIQGYATDEMTQPLGVKQ